jgi:SM-20-related protein
VKVLPIREDFENIIDGLADQGYAVADGFLSATEVDNILEGDEFKVGKLQFKPAGIGRGQEHRVRETIRGDKILWLERDLASPPLKHYFNLLYALIEALNQGLFLSLKSVEIHIAAYAPGTFYKRHLDQFKADDHRKISIICYLNRNWSVEDGGQLRLHLPNGHYDILPVAGRLVCFRSDLIEHEVLPTHRERLSLTGWMKDSL